jgi:hypothetical protein
MKERFERLVNTLICKNTVAWIVSCVFLSLKMLTGPDWCMLTGAIFIGKAFFEWKSGNSSVTTKGAEGE